MEEDGIGAQVEGGESGAPGEGGWDRGTVGGEEVDQGHLKEEDEKGPQIKARRYNRALAFTLPSSSTNWVVHFSMIIL